jgi:NitT/TauT family transport system substrate-binding protein
MNRWIWGGAAVAAALVGIAYVSVGAQKSAPADKVVIAQVADFFLYAPVYVAKDGGFFAKNNLDVTITTAGGDEKAWAAVISGSAQFGVGDPTFVAIADQHGQPGRVVASIVNGVPFWGVTQEPGVPVIKRPSDLGSFSVATFPSPSTAYTLQAEMFRRGGLKPNIREGAFGALIPMLSAGQADIALELEPNVSTAVAKQHVRVVYSLADIYGDFAITGLTATPQYLAANPDIARRVVCSLKQADDFIRKNQPEALHILTKRFPEVSADVAREALLRVEAKNIVPSTVETSESAWRKALQLRLQAGDLKSAKPMSAYVDNSFAADADRRCSN